MQVIYSIESWTYPIVYLALLILCIIQLKNRGGEFLAGAFGTMLFTSIMWRIIDIADLYSRWENIYLVMNHVNYFFHLVFTALFIVGILKLADSTESKAGASPKNTADMPLSQLLFSFQGRINRAKFWAVWGALNAASLLIWLILWAISESGEMGRIIALLFYFMLLIPFCWIGLAMQVKRWHDRDKPGTMVFINFIPFVGMIWAFIEMGFLEGTQGPNQYGEDPLRPAGNKGAK